MCSGAKLSMVQVCPSAEHRFFELTLCCVLECALPSADCVAGTCMNVIGQACQQLGFQNTGGMQGSPEKWIYIYNAEGSLLRAASGLRDRIVLETGEKFKLRSQPDLRRALRAIGTTSLVEVREPPSGQHQNPQSHCVTIHGILSAWFNGTMAVA